MQLSIMTSFFLHKRTMIAESNNSKSMVCFLKIPHSYVILRMYSSVVERHKVNYLFCWNNGWIWLKGCIEFKKGNWRWENECKDLIIIPFWKWVNKSWILSFTFICLGFFWDIVCCSLLQFWFLVWLHQVLFCSDRTDSEEDKDLSKPSIKIATKNNQACRTKKRQNKNNNTNDNNQNLGRLRRFQTIKIWKLFFNLAHFHTHTHYHIIQNSSRRDSQLTR